jgi:DNA-binding transcriptional MocR family regulator
VKPILFNRGIPAPESFGIDNVARATRDVLAEHGGALLQYGPAKGFLPLRAWLAAWQGVTADEVLLGNGSLQLLDFLCMALLERGDLVFTESPTYDRTLTLLRRHGARVVGVPLAADGPDLERLEQELQKARPRFFYVIPDFQNPAGATCSAAKRRRIAELARQHDFLIVEDAPYRQLRYRGVEERSLYSLAPERTVQMSSFSKLIGPGPRVGFLVGAAALLDKAARLAEDTYICPNNLAHGIAYEWCRRGLLPLQVERLRGLYAPRLDACLEALGRHLPDAAATRPEGGFFVSLTLPEDTSTSAVREAARARELQLADGTAFFPNGGGERFLRLPFCALSPGEIEEGIGRLGETVRALRGATAVA